MIKKVLISIFIVLLLAISGLVAYSYYNKDKIINLFITEANKSLNTPIDVGSIDFTLLRNFPHLSISMFEVSIMESSGNQKSKLGNAEKLYFNFNIWDLLTGKYTVDEMEVVGGQFDLKRFEDGTVNYKVISAPAESSSKGGLEFNISSIKLKDVQLSYWMEKGMQYYQFSAIQLKSGLQSNQGEHELDFKGDILLDSISTEALSFGERELFVDGSLSIEDNNSMFVIHPSLARLEESDFSVEGFVGPGSFDLLINSDRASLVSITALLPEVNQKQISRYRSKGTILLKSRIRQEEGKGIGMELDFAAREASIYYPEYDRSLDKLQLEGKYVIKDVSKPEGASLVLNPLKGELEGKPFSGFLELGNFSKYPIRTHIEAEVDLGDLLEFYPVSSISNPGGELSLDIDMEGDLKGSEQNVLKASGEVDLRNVAFQWSNSPAPFKNLNGNFIFNNEDIAISDFSGEWGNSDFMINGFLKNVLQKIADPKTRINVEADLNSKYIDLDELLAIEQKDQKDTAFQFTIPSEIGLSFKCRVDRLNIGRFKSRNNYGNLKVSKQIARLSNVSFNVAGGKVDLDAEIDARHPDSVFVYSETAYDHIEVDSIFYIFNNFNQDFLEDRHLKGQVYANVTSSLDFDRYLNLNVNSFLTETSFSIRNGELNNFEPMQKLSRYLGGQPLDHLMFSDLENRIVIEEQTVYLPEMEVRSNVTNISIKGTHTFDQKINYSIKVPLNRNIKPDKDEAFGAIENDGTGRAMLFLTIKGTTEDYKIAYDTKSVRKKIIQDIKKEGQELKEVFKNKGKVEEKTVELEEEEYFDFEEDSTSNEK